MTYLLDLQPPSQGLRVSQSQLRPTNTLPLSAAKADPKELELSWGYLQPMSSDGRYIYFRKTNEYFIIGNEGEKADVERVIGDGEGKVNESKGKEKPIDIHLHGTNISYNHCKIVFNRITNLTMAVTLRNLSRKGTYVNGELAIGNVHLHSGDKIGFGVGDTISRGGDEYRYIYHDLSKLEKGIYSKYELTGKIGQGTFATVYHAIHKETHKIFAVKTLTIRRTLSGHSSSAAEKENTNVNADSEYGLKHSSRSRLSRKRSILENKGKPAKRTLGPRTDHQFRSFIQEIDIFQRMKHANICKLLEIYEDNEDEGNGVHLVLPYIGGGDLQKYVRERRGLNEADSKWIMYQILLALRYIHDENIIHRDLKPENILLITDHYKPIVKVTDFGLAKAMDRFAPDKALYTICGTTHYQAPEMVLNPEGGYTKLVDMYAAGIIAYYLLTCNLPYNESYGMTSEERTRARSYFDWDLLHHRINKIEVNTFISQLVEAKPKLRMTASNALRHEWIIDLTEMLGMQGLTKDMIDPYLIASQSQGQSQSLSQKESQEERRSVTMREWGNGKVTVMPDGLRMVGKKSKENKTDQTESSDAATVVTAENAAFGPVLGSEQRFMMAPPPTAYVLSSEEGESLPEMDAPKWHRAQQSTMYSTMRKESHDKDGIGPPRDEVATSSAATAIIRPLKRKADYNSMDREHLGSNPEAEQMDHPATKARRAKRRKGEKTEVEDPQRMEVEPVPISVVEPVTRRATRSSARLAEKRSRA